MLESDSEPDSDQRVVVVSVCVFRQMGLASLTISLVSTLTNREMHGGAGHLKQTAQQMNKHMIITNIKNQYHDIAYFIITFPFNQID